MDARVCQQSVAANGAPNHRPWANPEPSAVSGFAGVEPWTKSGGFEPVDQGFDLPWLTDVWDRPLFN